MKKHIFLAIPLIIFLPLGLVHAQTITPSPTPKTEVISDFALDIKNGKKEIENDKDALENQKHQLQNETVATQEIDDEGVDEINNDKNIDQDEDHQDVEDLNEVEQSDQGEVVNGSEDQNENKSLETESEPKSTESPKPSGSESD